MVILFAKASEEASTQGYKHYLSQREETTKKHTFAGLLIQKEP